MRRVLIGLFGLGATLFLSGAAMRVYAQINQAQTESRLLADRPESAAKLALGTASFTRADGIPTRLAIPALGLWNSLEGVTMKINGDWSVSDAGWHISSGRPGQGVNVVLAGHSPSRDPQIWAHSVFRQLAYLRPGDEIEIRAGSHTYTYAVSNVFAIPGSEAASAAATVWLQPGTSDRLTLITCWPPHTAAYRVIVVAQPLKERSED